MGLEILKIIFKIYLKKFCFESVFFPATPDRPSPRPPPQSLFLPPRPAASAHLGLREAQGRGQLRSLGQRQVLSLLETPLKSRQLEAGVDGAGFPDFLWLPVHDPNFRLEVLFFCKDPES